MSSRRLTRSIAAALSVLAVASACLRDSSSAATSTGPGSSSQYGPVRPELAKIKHIVIILQENRSFDHYFGTYPGADGIPMANGVPRHQ
jgi:phospholipase C